MTVAISGPAVADRLNAVFPGVVLESSTDSVTVPAERVVEVALFLRDDPELDCKFLNCLTAVDLMDSFEVVYVLSSLAKNHILTLKARSGHESHIVPSVNSVWMGANLQEREAYDLCGVQFTGHRNLRRILCPEDWVGHPLRKDYEMPLEYHGIRNR